jgi:NAD-dependent DNA ligase
MQKTPLWFATLIALTGIAMLVTLSLWVGYQSQAAGLREDLQMMQTQLAQMKLQKLALEKKFAADDANAFAAKIKERETEIKLSEEKVIEARGDVQAHLQAELQSFAEQKESINEHRNARLNALTQADSAVNQLQLQQKQAMENERTIDGKLRQSREAVELASRELERTKRVQREAIKANDDVIARRTARIQELLDRPDISTEKITADARILEARATSGFVFIDRGINDHLAAGTTFTIYNRRAGKIVTKGTVEVSRLFADMAECRVVKEVNANDPMVPGDMAHNPVYNPDEVKTFVIKGRFSRFNAAELAAKITATGGKVEENLSTHTHYLIAGDGSEDALVEAHMLGVRIFSEVTLLEFLQPHDLSGIRKSDNRKSGLPK